MLSRDAIPHLEKTNGSILFNSSITGAHPNADLGAYSVSKAALNALVVALALECGKKGVRVNGIMPAIIEDTDFAKVYWNFTQRRGSKSALFSRNIPIYLEV